MPSLRHNSAMLSSPRRPAITMRIFSSAEYCHRVACRISRTRVCASSESISTFVLIVRSLAVKDQLKILVSLIRLTNMKLDEGAAGRKILGRARPEESAGRRAHIWRSKPEQSPGPRSSEPASRKERHGLCGGMER
jgi:hypothetical protein